MTVCIVLFTCESGGITVTIAQSPKITPLHAPNKPCCVVSLNAFTSRHFSRMSH